MNINNLSKEQKQYIVLAILAAIILVTLMVLGIRFSLSSIKEAKGELEILAGKIESADRTLSRSDQVAADFRSTIDTLRGSLKGIPPERNYYSWATEVIYSLARDIGLEITSIDEIGGTQGRPKQGKADDIRLESYALRISAQGGFNNVKQFIQSMQLAYPLVRFTGLDITSGKTPDAHKVQLWLQWPFNLSGLADNWDSVDTMRNSAGGGDAGDSKPQPSEERMGTPVHSSSTKPRPVAAPTRTEPVAATKSEPEPVAAPAKPEPAAAPEFKSPEPVPQPVEQVRVLQQPKTEPTPPPPRPEAESVSTQVNSLQSPDPKPAVQIENEPEQDQTTDALPAPVSVESEGSSAGDSKSIAPETGVITLSSPEKPEPVAVNSSLEEPEVQSASEPQESADEASIREAEVNENQKIVQEKESDLEPALSESGLEPVVEQVQPPTELPEPMTAEPESLAESPEPAVVESEVMMESGEPVAVEPEAVMESPEQAPEPSHSMISAEKEGLPDPMLTASMPEFSVANESAEPELAGEIDAMLSDLETIPATPEEDPIAEPGPKEINVDNEQDADSNAASSADAAESGNADSTYVATGGSAQKLESLLMDTNDVENNDMLDSLLDSLIGGQQ